MPRSLVLLICAAALLAADKDKTEGFKPAAASTFANVQKQNGAMLAAAAYTSDGEARQAFGKVNPYEHGVLPVLLVMENKGKETLRLQGIQVQYIDRNRRKVENIPAQDVRFLRAPQRPRMPGTTPLPPIPIGKKKNPLDAFEITARAFSAKMLPPGDSANGFFYFQAEHRPGAVLYVTGIQEASTGKELFYFEIPLD
jgi:hypothetical protein